MTSNSDKLRAVFLTALMIGSVFAAGIAFTGAPLLRHRVSLVQGIRPSSVPLTMTIQQMVTTVTLRIAYDEGVYADNTTMGSNALAAANVTVYVSRNSYDADGSTFSFEENGMTGQLILTSGESISPQDEGDSIGDAPGRRWQQRVAGYDGHHDVIHGQD